MAAKDRSASAKKELKNTVRKLRSKLDQADANANRLKRQAARLDKARVELEDQVKKLKKRNQRLKKAATPAAEPAPMPAAPTSAAKPDAGWTVAQLRAEARERGLTGMSSKTKAQLLDALR